MSVDTSSCKVRVIVPIFSIKCEFTGQIIDKYSSIKFHENPSSEIRVVPCGRTDRHDVTNRRSSQFCEVPKTYYE